MEAWGEWSLRDAMAIPLVSVWTDGGVGERKGGEIKEGEMCTRGGLIHNCERICSGIIKYDISRQVAEIHSLAF